MTDVRERIDANRGLGYVEVDYHSFDPGRIWIRVRCSEHEPPQDATVLLTTEQVKALSRAAFRAAHESEHDQLALLEAVDQ